MKPELDKQYQKEINLTATNKYIDIGNRRLINVPAAIDKYDVTTKDSWLIVYNIIICFHFLSMAFS